MQYSSQFICFNCFVQYFNCLCHCSVLISNLDNNANEEDEEEDDDDELDDDDDDDDDYDEDDEAEFALFEQTKKLKASILFAQDTKIAQ